MNKSDACNRAYISLFTFYFTFYVLIANCVKCMIKVNQRILERVKYIEHSKKQYYEIFLADNYNLDFKLCQQIVL